MRSLGLAVLLGRQEDLQWLGAAEGDGLGGGRRLAESIWLWAKEEKLLAIFCNSLIFGRRIYRSKEFFRLMCRPKFYEVSIN